LYGKVIQDIIEGLYPVDGSQKRLAKALEEISALIKICIHVEPLERPNLATIMTTLEKTLFDDITLFKIWKKLNKNWKVTWGMFWKELLYIGGGSKAVKYSNYEMLFKELIASSEEDILERLHKLQNWFPMQDATIFDDVIDICKEGWFYGFLSTDETTRILQRNKSPHCFLARFSTTIPGAYSIVYKYVDNGSKALNQLRIIPTMSMTESGKRVFVTEYEAHSQLKFSSLKEAINRLREDKLIGKPCSGSPYAKLLPTEESQMIVFTEETIKKFTNKT